MEKGGRGATLTCAGLSIDDNARLVGVLVSESAKVRSAQCAHLKNTDRRNPTCSGGGGIRWLREHWGCDVESR